MLVHEEFACLTRGIATLGRPQPEESELQQHDDTAELPLCCCSCRCEPRRPVTQHNTQRANTMECDGDNGVSMEMNPRTQNVPEPACGHSVCETDSRDTTTDQDKSASCFVTL